MGLTVPVVLLAACAQPVPAAQGPGGGGVASSSSSSAVVSTPLPAGSLLDPADLDQLLPGLAPDAAVRVTWTTVGEEWEPRMMRDGCAASGGMPVASVPTAQADALVAQQWWQGTTPQHATLDVLRWPEGGAGDTQAWRTDAAAAESACQDSAVLPRRSTDADVVDLTVVVHRWGEPGTGGTPGRHVLPLWQVDAFAVVGSTGFDVRVGSYSAATPREAWAVAEPGVSQMVALAVERVATAGADALRADAVALTTPVP